MIEIPRTDYDPKTRRATLREPVMRDTGITGQTRTAPNVHLHRDGWITVKPGFVFDYGSFAIDTPGMVYASVVHDALYVLIITGALPKKYRRRADTLLREMLEEAGETWLRRWYVWAAVRWGYPIIKTLGWNRGQ